MDEPILFEKHPCFNEKARHTSARIHLPVAPKCNIQCKFCDRKYDCVNESRPGVSSTILTPRQAAEYLERVLEKIPNITVVGIAGPGDPFANEQETLQTCRLIRQRHPDMLLCIATNGLGLAEHVGELKEIGVSHVTVTVNAIDPEIGSRIYSWVRADKKVLRGVEAARELWRRQEKAIVALKAAGIVTKINSIIIPGVNDRHIPEIARYMAGLGADILNCMPLHPVKNTEFAELTAPSCAETEQIREAARVFLPQMAHCQRCRADAVGMLGHDRSQEMAQLMREITRPQLSRQRPFVAVASMEGIFVNLHLGEAKGLWIFRLNEDNSVELVERRTAPPVGEGMTRWFKLRDLLQDCCAVLVTGVGQNPKIVLEESGIQVIAMEGMIAEALPLVLSGQDLPAVMVKTAGKCGGGSCGGGSCGGGGMGCM